MMIKTRSLTAAFAAALAMLISAWGQASAVPVATTPQPSFDSPRAAAVALADAVRAADPQSIARLMGPDTRAWLFTGDDVADAREWTAFLKAWDQRNSVIELDASYAVLLVGDDDWAFPAPIVKQDGRWVFDGAAGRNEVTNRRVGRNELNAIQVLLSVVDAQREYAAADADGDGYHDYAARFLSSPGERDGLYWPVPAGEQQSPLGPLIGMATADGYGREDEAAGPRPYHGYHFRLLSAQGADAPGGAYDYVVNGRLLGGFAVLAYPANYAVSGVMTLSTNHTGIVYQKDLGDDTATTAAALTTFNPDPTWARADQASAP